MNKTYKTLLIVLVLLVVGLAIGFVAYNQELTIDSSAEVSPEDGETDAGGTGGGGSGDTGTTTTLASVTNANIGDYIDLGNNIVGTSETTDDWRILYVEGSTVYAILADYLPNSTGYATSAGLDTYGTYNVYSNYKTGSRDKLLTGLTTTSNWSGLANGVSGATVTGSPTAELLMNSYNTKNGTRLVYTYDPTLDSSTEDYDLYVPHTSEYERCCGFWLASPYAGNTHMVKYVNVSNNEFSYGSMNTTYYCFTTFGLRPVVSLPSSISVVCRGDLWTVVN